MAARDAPRCPGGPFGDPRCIRPCGSVAFAVIPLLFAWGVAGFVLSPALQARVVGAAGPGNTLASSLNISAFNVGIAAGSLVGTAVVAGGGLASTPLVAAGLAAVAVAPAVLGSRRSVTPVLGRDLAAVGAPTRAVIQGPTTRSDGARSTKAHG